MPRPHPSEFRQQTVELARLREKPIAQIADELGIAELCPRNWMKQADIDDGRRNDLLSDERAELVQLRRNLRTAKMEIEILKRAAPHFAMDRARSTRTGKEVADRSVVTAA